MPPNRLLQLYVFHMAITKGKVRIAGELRIQQRQSVARSDVHMSDLGVSNLTVPTD